jgi:outer membrane autotransporter protein
MCTKNSRSFIYWQNTSQNIDTQESLISCFRPLPFSILVAETIFKKREREMGYKRITLVACTIVTLYCTAQAAVEQNVTQPIGTLVRTWTPTGGLPFPVQNPPWPAGYPLTTPLPTTAIGEVNWICAQWDGEETPQTAPFDTNYPATEVILTQQQHFVRLLVGTSSGVNGAWIMRSEYVRGKTPAQLQDIFALASPPLDIVNVEMPASPDPTTGKNYALWTGIAGPILDPPLHNWGNGGAPQSRLIVDAPPVPPNPATTYFPNYMYTASSTRNHRQPVGPIALSYKPMAGNCNAGRVAEYLDTFVPVAYSDLENVYHALDYLNYVGFGPAPLQDALQQISPERFSGFASTAARNSILFSSALLDGSSYKRAQRQESCSADSGCYTNASKFNFWVNGLGEWDNSRQGDAHTLFDAHSGGIMACLDVTSRPHFLWGVGFTGLYNHLTWCDETSSARGGSAKVGLYASYCRSTWFMDGVFCAGGHWNSMKRGIVFLGVDRQANSKPRGGDVDLHLQVGKTLHNLATPILKLSYFFNHCNCVTECGADSLNLQVQAFNTHTFRTNLGLEIDPVLDTANQAKIIPHAAIAWINDAVFHKRPIRARLVGPDGYMCATGFYQTQNSCLVNVGCNCVFPCNCALSLTYDAQLRKGFTAQTVQLGLAVTF